MKIHICCSTLDLKCKLGCTPSWWQLLKALHETGNEVIAVPFIGDHVESLWWCCFLNLCAAKRKLYKKYLDWNKTLGIYLIHGATNQKSIVINEQNKHIYIMGKRISWMI